MVASRKLHVSDTTNMFSAFSLIPDHDVTTAHTVALTPAILPFRNTQAELAHLDAEVLQPFSHIPPSSVTGHQRWPLSLDTQAYPVAQSPQLHDILIHI